MELIQKGKGIFLIPPITDGSSIFITTEDEPDQPVLARVIGKFPRATDDEIKEFVALYRATKRKLQALEKSRLSDLGEISAGMYFADRLNKWFQIGQGLHVVRDGFLSLREQDMIFGIIGNLVGSLKLKMSFFFNLFGNTDIEKTEDGQYLIYNVRLEPKPREFGPAAFIWNLILYSWDVDPAGMAKRVKQWMNAFYPEQNPAEIAHFHANLMERIVGALCVDLPEARSPFDGANKKYIPNVARNIRHFLMRETRL